MDAALITEIETRIDEMDFYRLRRARLIMQSDLWSANRNLDDWKSLHPGRLALLQAERKRLKAALDMVSGHIQKMEIAGA